MSCCSWATWSVTGTFAPLPLLRPSLFEFEGPFPFKARLDAFLFAASRERKHCKSEGAGKGSSGSWFSRLGPLTHLGSEVGLLWTHLPVPWSCSRLFRFSRSSALFSDIWPAGCKKTVESRTSDHWSIWRCTTLCLCPAWERPAKFQSCIRSRPASRIRPVRDLYPESEKISGFGGKHFSQPSCNIITNLWALWLLWEYYTGAKPNFVYIGSLRRSGPKPEWTPSLRSTVYDDKGAYFGHSPGNTCRPIC